MKTGVLVAALALLIPMMSATAQDKGNSEAAKNRAALLHPENLKEKAPATFKVKFETTKGEVIIDVTRAWSPLGADRFYTLVKHGFFDGNKFFRVVPNFVVQFGINGDPAITAKWMNANINDDKVVESNKRGYITFAKTNAPNSRSTQFFINLADNPRLDEMGFSPFGKVTKGMDLVDKIYSGYGEQPNQGQISMEGNKYLDQNFPKLDAIKKATLVK